MKSLILVLTALTPLVAEMPSSNVSSDQAAYDGDILSLEGNVTLNHELGDLHASRAFVHKGKPSLDFSSVHLQESVSITFKNQGKLFSDEAFLDFQTLKGHITSQDSPVIYRDETLELFSDSIDLKLMKTENSFDILTLIALDNVHIQDIDGAKLSSDSAEYLKTENQLIARAKSPSAPCRASREEGTVDALEIHADLNTSLLTLYSATGKLTSPFSSENFCKFAAEKVLWNDADDELILEKSIALYDRAIGTLIGEKLFKLKQKRIFTERVIQSIETEGFTKLVTTDGQSLTTHGTLSIDRDTLVMVCTSPHDRQLSYENDELSLFADHARVEFDFHQMELQPDVIYLDGDVRIFSRDAERPLRKGVADHLIHDPHTRETRLIADGGRRVLFWDDLKNLTLSAPEIIISRDEAGEETIRGCGKVRFTFTEDEGKRIETLMKGLP